MREEAALGAVAGMQVAPCLVEHQLGGGKAGGRTSAEVAAFPHCESEW